MNAKQKAVIERAWTLTYRQLVNGYDSEPVSEQLTFLWQDLKKLDPKKHDRMFACAVAKRDWIEPK